MRILYVCGGSYVSGTEIVELSIMEGLAERGHEVHCVVNGWNDGDFVARLDALGIGHTTAFLGKLSLSLRPRYLWWTLGALRHAPGARRTVARTLAAVEPDVVVVCNRDALLLLGRVLERRPVVLHVHEAPPLTVRSRQLMARMAKRVRLLVGVSQFLGERLAALAVDRARIRVVLNGIRPVCPPPPATVAPRPFTIGICGQIAPWKGHETLIEALALLAGRRIGFRCLVFGAGQGDFIAHLKRQAAARGVAERLEWRGFVRDQAALYRELDVVAVPSSFDEPLGLAALEGGLHGLPVVASRRGGLPEIVLDGETGFLVPSDDPEALAARLATLARAPGLRHRQGAAARRRVLEQFALERMVHEHEAVLEEAVAS